jgi:hypothetical protein
MDGCFEIERRCIVRPREERLADSLRLCGEGEHVRYGPGPVRAEEARDASIRKQTVIRQIRRAIDRSVAAIRSNRAVNGNSDHRGCSRNPSESRQIIRMIGKNGRRVEAPENGNNADASGG